KAVNALSEYFLVRAVRDGKSKEATFQQGEIRTESKIIKSSEETGTIITFKPDEKIFKTFEWQDEFVEQQLWNYAWLNSGLKLRYNGKVFQSRDGLLDMMTRKTTGEELRYPIIHLKGEDIEIALTHGVHYGEQYYSFVNGQNTTQGGTHLNAFKEAIVKTFRDFYNKNFDPKDIRSSIIGAISVRIEEPVFESQTKTKLGSSNIAPEGVTVRSFINDFVTQQLDNYLHKHPDTAREILKRIQQSERERKEIAGIKKLANQRAKSANLHNKKLRDCKVHYNDSNRVDGELKEQSSVFITEGDSASGSLTKARDVQTQAVFSLRGKPLNCYGMTKKVVYQNEEFNLLQHALNIEDSLEDLRYNKVIIATDADVDGMHIRLLLLTFFLQFFPELVREGHLFILETPLFRVRDKQQTYYCYNEKEKQNAILQLRGKPEITRFKGLGEISPDEFGAFIGEKIHLEPVLIQDDTSIDKVLEY
ncbi:MAG TPA: toprim domain-containing protein, partial [Saprospiraceae bacterium]|nr:toprim domain-containing protein [Saprospiraceae bacterium]